MEPSELLGRVVVRPAVDGVAFACRGRVVEHDEITGFRVLYTDGDCEDYTFRELLAVRGTQPPFFAFAFLPLAALDPFCATA